ncbi:hypothetical protein [Spirulina sp. CS-785/01]|uniref:hypothetical protein n=1 Tax=Spirulina sp. CS-785/01 TaxID=3021716 RepID=UPI002330023C|nr:hypothetical protein [Spirulina sp. CS-785/01]
MTGFSMEHSLEMQEVAIAINVADFNPGSFNLDFLKMSGIIPKDWELVQQPVLNNALSQISFTNGVNIIAQPRTITFLEAINKRELSAILAPRVARQCLDKLAHAEYRGVGINPKILIGFPQQEDAARKYIVETLLAPGEWREFGQAPLKASINLSYQLSRCPLSLNITEVRLQQPQQGSIPALLFTGGFAYSIPKEHQSQKAAYLKKRISNWQGDFEAFREMIHKKFLGEKRTLFPNQIL